MCGALKNIYAILAGFLDLKPGTTPHKQYLTEVSEEMKAILSLNEAKPETVELSCGIGDLRLTCDTPSRNYEFGQILKNNPMAKPEKTVEGVNALLKVKNKEIKIPETVKRLRELIDLSDNWKNVWG